MNEERLLGIIADMSESVEQLKKCKEILENRPEDETSVFITYGLKQLFVDFFITVEDFTSLMLKELRKYKIGIDMKQALSILLENKVFDEENYLFLNQARLIRNRISHRYKEPSRNELLSFVETHENSMDKVLAAVKCVLKK